MSVHNTEVHRCRDCNEVVVTVPAGFDMPQEELDALALAHQEKCTERTNMTETVVETEVPAESAEAPREPVETWRDWTDEDAARQPKRICSTAGCKEKPTRVKETQSWRKDGTPTVRKHVYCDTHVPV